MAMTDVPPVHKALLGIRRNTRQHWVGDGFPVRTLLSYTERGDELSPFLLLDYAGPVSFPPTTARLGVGEHPHRGFETVTIVYAGEVEHRDSSGGGGRIGPGDVQWMTAGSGVVHEEFHGREFARQGGAFEMVQLWVNLPARDKMTQPRYQSIQHPQIPCVALPGDAGTVRVIAGEFSGVAGPALTHTPLHIWDLRVIANHPLTLTVPEGYTTALVVLQGSLQVAAGASIQAAEVGLFARQGTDLSLVATADARLLLLCGQPIDEPIVGHGPFVMNTPAQIQQAIADYHSGKMGRLA